MKRITINLEPELHIRLKLEALRSHTTIAAVVSAAVRKYLARDNKLPPGAGAFRSGRKTTADRLDNELSETRFGKN